MLKLLFLFLGLYSYFSGNQVNGSTQVTKTQLFEVIKYRVIDSYRITISRDRDHFIQNLSISKNGMVVFNENSEPGEYYYFGEDSEIRDPFSGRDITGNGIKDLVISKWTGGNHCCMQFYIFELGDVFKRIAKIDPFAMDIKLVDIDHDGVFEIEFYEESIMELFSCAANSRPGKVILRWNHDQYELARNLMIKKSPSQTAMMNMKKKILRSFQDRLGNELTPEFLEIMMNLSYSGNVDLALKIAEETWIDSKEKLEDFKLQFLDAMKDSEYWMQLYQK